MPPRLALEDLIRRAEQDGMCDSGVEQELFALHEKHGNILKPEDFQQTSDKETTPTAATTLATDATRSEQPESSTSTAARPARTQEESASPGAVATEHSQDANDPRVELASQELPADKIMIYSILNEFLGLITFNSTEAEEKLLAALEDLSSLTPWMHQRLQEVFSPIFFYYPQGLKDRSIWEPRDAGQYIRNWRTLAAMRTLVAPDATANHGEPLRREQVTQIFKHYMEELKADLRPEQRNREWKYYKSCTEQKMRDQAGSTFVANAIWTIKLPQLPPFATEQREKQLSKQDLEAIPGAIQNVLNWLDHLASVLQTHRGTSEYEEAVRKSGLVHGKSGLTATEQEIRTHARKVRFDMHTAKKLARQWDERTLTAKTWKPWQERLLRAYWDGSLHQRRQEISSADPMCRMPYRPLAKWCKAASTEHGSQP